MVKLIGARTPAKINLFLRVTGRRADGYHELDSIFLPIDLCDSVALSTRPADAASIALRCDTPGLGPDNDNLAVRAARAFMTEFEIRAAVTIELRKAIPVGAGLGGGSSDAAAVLRLLAELYGIGDRDRLAPIALRLGADAPFFLRPAPARVTGIGERIEPLLGFAPLKLVIAVPPIVVPTATVFRKLQAADWSGPAADSAVASLTAGHCDRESVRNDLARVATEEWPVIEELRRSLMDCGAIVSAMSGSGGAVFGIFASRAKAAVAADKLQRLHPQSQTFATVSLTI